MVWIVSREKGMIPFSTFCEPVIRLPSMRGGLVVRGWTPDVGCPAPFCFPVVVGPLALLTCFLTVFLCRVFLACVRAWRRLAWVCRHTFYIMVYLRVFRYRL